MPVRETPGDPAQIDNHAPSRVELEDMNSDDVPPNANRAAPSESWAGMPVRETPGDPAQIDKRAPSRAEFDDMNSDDVPPNANCAAPSESWAGQPISDGRQSTAKHPARSQMTPDMRDLSRGTCLVGVSAVLGWLTISAHEGGTQSLINLFGIGCATAGVCAGLLLRRYFIASRLAYLQRKGVRALRRNLSRKWAIEEAVDGVTGAPILLVQEPAGRRFAILPRAQFRVTIRRGMGGFGRRRLQIAGLRGESGTALSDARRAAAAYDALPILWYPEADGESDVVEGEVLIAFGKAPALLELLQARRRRFGL
ncbi:hypothetical protein [Burkholderia sp. MBR-1]|uniref:hypothetical protein n=1 Tax=Burkholderia sp. MBR-1 TaxID=2732364 RepID=UPI0015EE49F5|nr:hypothetical protein [Burkholderia sp. MBR-1]QMI49785.1 hypothetical protein MBR110_30410 [Burkholderia sp. MBR-1]